MEKMEAKLSDLEKQVLNLNVMAKVIIGVAVVFGVAGGWGYKILHGAQEDLENVTSNVESIEKKMEEADKYYTDLRVKHENILTKFSESKKIELQTVEGRWPAGSYCIVKKDGCPDGFSSGNLYLDTEDDDGGRNKWSGNLPSFELSRKGVIMYFCCKSE